ncbi:YdcF family protein [Shewanella sp. SR44-3]|uniref:YdcF family protein n=1 Tax=Shewanella sp. SR44-3 TaxID=2760936 RepID=UPI0015F8BF19|nr:YdcF family protein [Shewanella sp. SR44-3]MBB1270657.1 YdcF family protein [Shewanella sp. SR44-3]
MPDPDVLFWFKKLLTQLVMPLPLLFLLLVILLILINQRSAITKGLANVLANTLVLAMLGIVLLSQAQVSREIGGGLENKYRANHQPIVGECTVMVLGSGHSLLTGLSATQQLSPTALARLVEGVRQLKLSQQNTESTGICRLVVSGWNGGREGLAHAEVMALAALELGVIQTQIITFPEARDTIEELLSMKTLIGDAPFRLVTSATHMPRAMRIARGLGLTPEAAPSNFLADDGSWWRLNADNLVLSQAAIHEYVGMLWLDVKAWWAN